MLANILFVVLLSIGHFMTSESLLTPTFPGKVQSSSISGRIVNGYPASRGQFPHQVKVLSHAGTGVYVCGGSIISEDWVLTACHCTKFFTSFELGFGSVNFQTPQVVVRTNIKIEHSGYDPTNLNNDIALLKIPIKLGVTSTISPVQLPSYRHALQDFLGVRAVVSGFGKSDEQSSEAASAVLNYVNQRVIGNSECTALYGPDVIRNFTLCARGWDHNNQGACQGDSGGPLIAYDKEIQQNILIGIVSFVSDRGCAYGDPSGYVRVSHYLKWIRDMTGIQIRP